MSGLAPNKVAPQPDLKALLDLHKAEIMISLNCHAVGTIQAFNKSNQTVQVSINYKKSFNGRLVDYPVLIDCPVIIMTGGSAHLTFPIAMGDTCLILFNDRDIDNWFSSGQIGPLSTQRMHSFSDGIALIGLRSFLNKISSYDDVRAVLRNDEAMVGVGPTLIKIANDTHTLNGLLQELVTDISNLVTQVAAITVICAAPASPSSVPVNAAAIVAIATQLSTTATKIAGLLE